MALDINKITSSNFAKGVAKKADKLASTIGGAIEKSSHKDVFYKTFEAVEPTGVNNSFFALAGTMFLGVLAPRIMTALKRNPDDKEKTKDEISDIVFRDVQTILIMLFALKSVNSVVAGLTTKINGLPMTNKAYQKLFNDNTKGLNGIKNKAQEFIQNPVDKLKKLGRNVLDTINPTGGVVARTNDEFVAQYSNFNSIDEVKKLLDEIPNLGGNSKKVYNKIINSLINEQEELINGNSKKGIKGLVQKAKGIANKNGSIDKATQKEIDNAKNILEELKSLKEKDYSSLDNASEATRNLIVNFFKDDKNALLTSAKGLNAVLRTGALVFEALYLGLGLPALNQKRLKKKYLTEGAQQPQTQQPEAKNTQDSFQLTNKNVTNEEAKIFKQFIK